MEKQIITFSLLAGLLFLLSCQKNNHRKIDNDTFVKIYCDIMTTTDLVDAGKKQALRDSILKNYNVTFEDYQFKLSSLKNNTDEWYKIYEKIVKELETRIKELEENESPKNPNPVTQKE